LNHQIVNLNFEFLEQVVQIEKSLRPETTWSRRIFCEVLNKAGTLSYVLLKEKKSVVGFFCAEVLFEEVYLLNFAVKEIFQRKGFGGKLLDFLIIESRRLKLKSISLEVKQSNFRAIGLYESRVFQKLGLRKKYYSQKEDALIMTLFLEQ